MYRPIRDYAIIGNLRSAVLVSKDASIDWAPAPFIDSPSIFAALLDEKKGGTWQIAPSEEYTSTQHYDGNTNIVVTSFRTAGGSVIVTDFIPIEQEKAFVPEEKNTTFRIHRKVTCERGSCAMRVFFAPRFDYARGRTMLSLVPGGVHAENGDKHGVLVANLPFTIESDAAIADIAMKEGETKYFVFRYNVGEVISREDAFEHHENELAETKNFWEKWVDRCDLSTCPVAGEWHPLIVRSSLLLKILFFEPTGTIAAAPTTSLPESVGGARNWDYRFTWLRDSAFTLQALFRLGYLEEAGEYVRWIIEICQDETRGKPEFLQALYGLHGAYTIEEEMLPHLSGYKNSKPVRVGNNAYHQKQWDIYGSILDLVWALHALRSSRHMLNDTTWDVLRGFANYVIKIWKLPDEGLWEVRTEKRHFVYSKVMCWVALDRAIKIAETHGLAGEIDLWKKEKKLIHDTVMKEGWDEKKQSFVQSFGSEALDAAVLTFSKLGFIDGKDPKMISTIQCIERELRLDDILFRRYNAPDGFTGEEGAFLLASFWFVDALILAGERKRAEQIFIKLTTLVNHVGLLSEEIHPKTGEFLGNFPQAYTHIGMVNSAFNLTEGMGEYSEKMEEAEEAEKTKEKQAERQHAPSAREERKLEVQTAAQKKKRNAST